MLELLVKHRDTLPVGQLIPLGAIYDVPADGQDQPFTDKLRDEFGQAMRFCAEQLLPHLRRKHNLAEGQQPSRAFRADAALNHGSVASMILCGERNQVAQTLRGCAGVRRHSV